MIDTRMDGFVIIVWGFSFRLVKETGIVHM